MQDCSWKILPTSNVNLLVFRDLYVIMNEHRIALVFYESLLGVEDIKKNLRSIQCG